LWGEVDKKGDLLFWCHGGAKLPVQPTVNGTTDGPFFLASLAGPIPNLNAILLAKSYVKTARIFCLYSKDIFEQCNLGQRMKDPSAFEKLMNKFG
jgi:hypothetical protein